jgi:hypothetical protein
MPLVGAANALAVGHERRPLSAGDVGERLVPAASSAIGSLCQRRCWGVGKANAPLGTTGGAPHHQLHLVREEHRRKRGVDHLLPFMN